MVIFIICYTLCFNNSCLLSDPCSWIEVLPGKRWRWKERQWFRIWGKISADLSSACCFYVHYHAKVWGHSLIIIII